MSTVEILDVSMVELNSEQLWGHHIDIPKPSSQADSRAITIIGWVLGRSCPAVAVELMQDDAVLQRVPINVHRPDVAAAFAEVSSVEESGFQTTISVLTIE